MRRCRARLSSGSGIRRFDLGGVDVRRDFQVVGKIRKLYQDEPRILWRDGEMLAREENWSIIARGFPYGSCEEVLNIIVG